MSYLRLPRLTFAGRFQADVSTVNNDVRHFDIGSFKSSFQNPQTPTSMNGWWNPDGTGAFRLVDVVVTRAQTAYDDPGSADPATGLALTGRQDRTAAKLVDLDPQFQMGSAIFGLEVVLTDGTDERMRGRFVSTAFRDISFARKATGGVDAASARFTSVLTDLVWSPNAQESPTLVALRAVAEQNGGVLSVNLMTAGFSAGSTVGSLLGAIGPYRSGDPQTFVSGRRLVVTSGAAATASGIGALDAEVVGDVLSLDLSNALPLAAGAGVVATKVGLGPLVPAVLRTADVTGPPAGPGVREGQQVTAADLTLLDPIDYLAPGWLHDTSGMVDLALDAEALALVADHPIALVQPLPDGGYVVLIREATAGLWARADPFEFRVDPPTSGTTSCTVRVRCTRWGVPVSGVPVGLQLRPREANQGGGGDLGPDAAPIPDINVPPEVLSYTPTFGTDERGWATTEVSVADPGNPRGYLDGQVYKFAYGLRVAGSSRLPATDLVVLHVRQAYDPPAQPEWKRDLHPFMQQYDNLYPVMSKGLFSLSDPTVAKQHASLLALAFGLDIDDPNHMPVTRDLSAGKRAAVLRWLARYGGEAGEPLPPRDPRESPALRAIAPEELDQQPAGQELETPSEASLRETLDALGDGHEGKTQALRDHLQSLLTERGEGDA